MFFFLSLSFLHVFQKFIKNENEFHKGPEIEKNLNVALDEANTVKRRKSKNNFFDERQDMNLISNWLNSNLLKIQSK